MSTKTKVKKLVDSIFCKEKCFGNILYPEPYSFFLDLHHLKCLLDFCDDARNKSGVTLPPDLMSREEKDHIIQSFDIEKHKCETIAYILKLLEDPSEKQRSVSARISSNRHSFAIEGLYRSVFYGCAVPLREYFEPVKKRGRKIPKKLVSKIIEDYELKDKFSVVGDTKADCRLTAIDSTFIKTVELSLTNWGRHLDVRVNFSNYEAIPLSEFFGISSEIYVHDDVEKRNAVVSVLQIISCINEFIHC